MELARPAGDEDRPATSGHALTDMRSERRDINLAVGREWRDRKEENASQFHKNLSDRRCIQHTACASVLHVTSPGPPGTERRGQSNGRSSINVVPATTAVELDAAVARAVESSRAWGAVDAPARSDALERVASAIEAQTDLLAELADAETALGVVRLRGEVARTAAQLRMFADAVRRGDYLDGIVSPGLDSRPDVRRMLFPIGVVAVYSASNFPFAFSVLGGDTASALAAGCSVIVKAHESHPRLSHAVGQVATQALQDAGAPDSLIQVVFGFDAGTSLVSHPDVAAAGFTGSLTGGRALFDLACRRSKPIPFFGELGSVNPVVVSRLAAAKRGREIAEGYAESLTLGVGQFCTNPGLVFAPPDLTAQLADAVAATRGGPMLTERMAHAYTENRAQRGLDNRIELIAEGAPGTGAWAVTPAAWRLGLSTFAADIDHFCEEVFGPCGLIVDYEDVETLLKSLEGLPGSLTAAVHVDDSESGLARALATVLRPRTGRLIYNGWPTGVAVCWAMHHGGPWPASTAPAHTSVGLRAIQRWLTPVAFQNWPEHLLPPELTRSRTNFVSPLTEP